MACPAAISERKEELKRGSDSCLTQETCLGQGAVLSIKTYEDKHFISQMRVLGPSGAEHPAYELGQMEWWGWKQFSSSWISSPFPAILCVFSGKKKSVNNVRKLTWSITGSQSTVLFTLQGNPWLLDEKLSLDLFTQVTPL